MAEKDSALKVSYQSKDELTCPVCDEAFRREELLSGSGRLNAGGLTDELHRLYLPSAKYGELYPLAYQATVCPKCWFASMEADFTQIPKDMREKAFDDMAERQKSVALINPDIDFYESRNLVTGAASQYLVMLCYDYYPASFSPTVKQGLATLRASWLLEEMDKKTPGQHYDWLAEIFKKKALFFYASALKLETTGKETLSGLSNLGPDTDKNYGYEGLLYINSLLEYKYGQTEDAVQRLAVLGEDKRNLAKMFGLGKSSKSKPGPLLEKSRNLYDTLAKELNEFDV